VKTEKNKELTLGHLLAALTHRESIIDVDKPLTEMTPGKLLLLEQDGRDYYDWSPRQLNRSQLSLDELRETIRNLPNEIKSELFLSITSKDLEEVSEQELLLYRLLREDQREQLANDDASPGELIEELYGRK
jgi:hypothetical protein